MLHDKQEGTVSERRVFTRLTTLASWRSEYILRTRLLRSLARGKPALLQGFGASGPSRSGPGQTLDELAWETGRTVGWTLLEPTRRQAKNDPFDRSDVDGSYSPKSSWNGMELGRHQLIAETKEIESFLKEKPRHFRKICDGWDMRRRLEVDFAGDCGNEDGESIVVCSCGLNEQPADIRRFTRAESSKISKRYSILMSFRHHRPRQELSRPRYSAEIPF